jgi:uncharacterized RDD family membrane protein YckC
LKPELDETLSAGAAPATPADGDALAAGARLGHFRIESKLGAGGMGEVFLATDLALDRPVAIKVLPAERSSGSARERLVREARAQARVHHPNVGHIYYIGDEAGRLYFAMEYLAGGTLADKIAAAPLRVDEALDVVRAAALGLREAHRSGFLHRDVKPSNLMCDAHDMVKVTDFGLAAGGGSEHAEDGPVAQTTMAGTPLYMAPEQARGEAIDQRADIYALGATLYHLVAGKPPFEAPTVEKLQTMHRSANRPQLPRKGQTNATATAIDALVARMMAPDPKDRFASYDELLRALELASTRHTRPAGFWVRCIAMGIDFILITFVLAVFKSLLLGGGNVNAIMAFPAVALVQTLAIARWGTTPGKALFELEVVAQDTGRRPRLARAFVRSLALYGPAIAAKLIQLLAGALTTEYIVLVSASVLMVAAILVMFVLLVHASLRVPGKRAPWDRIAGTMVRYRTVRAAGA